MKRKYRISRQFLRSLIAEHARDGAEVVALSVQGMRPADYMVLTQAGWVWNAQEQVLAIELSALQAQDLTALSLPEEMTAEDVEVLTAVYDAAASGTAADLGGEDEDEDEAPQEAASPARPAVAAPPSITQTSGILTAQPARPYLAPARAAQPVQPGAVALSTQGGNLQLSDSDRLLQQMVVNTRSNSARQLLLDATQRGVSAPVINFARQVLTALAPVMTADTILTLSAEEGGQDLDAFNAFAHLIGMIDGTVPITPRADGGKVLLSQDADPLAPSDAVREAAKRIINNPPLA